MTGPRSPSVPVNPAGGDLPPNVAALIAQELASLASDARTLAARLVPGDIVDATVLPSNGLTDLLDIGGLRVAAELPPSLVPGEVIRVLVTGLDGERINLQLVADPPAAPANEPPPAVAAPVIGASADAPVRAPSPPGDLASSRPVIVRSVLPPIVGRFAAQPAAGSSAPRPAAASPPLVLQSIEARLAAAHAAVSATRAPLPHAQRTPVPVAARPSAPLATGRTAPPAAASRPPGPAIEPRPAGSPGTAPAGTARATGYAAAARSPAAGQTARQPFVPGGAGSLPHSLAALSEPSALLRALRLPVTAANAAAARMALDSPENLPEALAALAKSTAAGSDPRSATLNTLASFLARIDPRSPVFAEQIAAFAEYVATGPEAKLAQLVRLAGPAAPPLDAEPADPAARPGSDCGPTSPPSPAAAFVVSPERLAGVQVALDYDLKTQLLALAAARAGGSGAPTSSGADLDRVVAGALVAITAVQLGAASALRENPAGFAFTLPVALPGGMAQAQVRIDRHAPGAPSVPLDADNFHIAFVLETKHLGTVAIELVTVGRAVSLTVKTEAARAQQRFGDALGGLRTRLEGLRYRVAATNAVIAPVPPAGSAPARNIAVADPSTRPVSAEDAARIVDIEA